MLRPRVLISLKNFVNIWTIFTIILSVLQKIIKNVSVVSLCSSVNIYASHSAKFWVCWSMFLINEGPAMSLLTILHSSQFLVLIVFIMNICQLFIKKFHYLLILISLCSVSPCSSTSSLCVKFYSCLLLIWYRRWTLNFQ